MTGFVMLRQESQAARARVLSLMYPSDTGETFANSYGSCASSTDTRPRCQRTEMDLVSPPSAQCPRTAFPASHTEVFPSHSRCRYISPREGKATSDRSKTRIPLSRTRAAQRCYFPASERTSERHWLGCFSLHPRRGRLMTAETTPTTLPGLLVVTLVIVVPSTRSAGKVLSMR